MKFKVDQEVRTIDCATQALRFGTIIEIRPVYLFPYTVAFSNDQSDVFMESELSLLKNCPKYLKK